MKQHEIDIENLKEKYKLEAEAKQLEHDLKIREMKTECENEFLKSEKEFENPSQIWFDGRSVKVAISSLLIWNFRTNF